MDVHSNIADSKLPASHFATRTLPGRPPPDKLESFNDLLAQAEHYAEHSMRNIGRLPATLFLIGSDGPLMFIFDSLADEKAQDDFAVTARLLCIAHAATACVMAWEAWGKFAKPTEKFDETERPAAAFDRHEFVILMGESHSQAQKQSFLPILRSDNGTFFGFGESKSRGMDEVKDFFAQLLPMYVPDEGIRQVAKAMLKVKGTGRAIPGAPLHLPGSRR